MVRGRKPENSRMAKETRAAKRAHWEGVLAQWRESGLSKAAFCREHEIRPRQFRYWFEHLAPGPDPSPAFAPVHCGGGRDVLRRALRAGRRWDRKRQCKPTPRQKEFRHAPFNLLPTHHPAPCRRTPVPGGVWRYAPSPEGGGEFVLPEGLHRGP